MKAVYINLPVTDLQGSTKFYQALGFQKNEKYCDENASGLMYNEHLMVMLLTHSFVENFLPTHKVVADSHATCGMLCALQMETKEEVDAFVNKALEAGGTLTIDPYDHGHMYGKDFEDPDGHIREVFRMDTSNVS